MIQIKKYACQLLLTAMVLAGCKEPYDPPVLRTNPSYLVVDGFLNNSTDTTFLRLSRTKKLDSNLVNSAEKNSQMTIEDNAGNTIYYFHEFNNDGTYIVPGMNLDINNKYKLRIKTTAGKEYVSDEITVVKTPPIDSISWQKTEKGVTIFSNTHDPLGNSKYYRWDYTETYEYHAAFFSNLKYENGLISGRAPNEYIYSCWRTTDSKSLLLASTTRLSQDIIYQNPLRFIEAGGIELDEKYSILVRQFSLTAPAYDYLQNLKRVSEQIGTLFDAQPSQLTGNIHCISDDNEPVLGFITACNMDSKRIYITNDQVAPWAFGYTCKRIQIANSPDSLELYFGGSNYIPLDYVKPLYGDPIWATELECADCRMLGGTTIKPDFWP